MKHQVWQPIFDQLLYTIFSLKQLLLHIDEKQIS